MYDNSCSSNQSLSYTICTQALASSFWTAPCFSLVLENRFPIDNDTNNLGKMKVSYNMSCIECCKHINTYLDKYLTLEKLRDDSMPGVLE